jgi:hypothetical protein
MALAVARQKRDAMTGDFSERENIAWRTVRRLDFDLVLVFEQRVESRAAEDPDFCVILQSFSKK